MQPTDQKPTGNRAMESLGFIGPVGLTIVFAFMGGETIGAKLSRLDYLEMPYPRILGHLHVIVSLIGLFLCLVCKRSTLPMIVLLLPTITIPLVARWADSRPIRIPVSRFIVEWTALQKNLGFKVLEQGDKRGTAIYVDRNPARADRVRAELVRMGVAKAE
jgi:hypothetical protein